MKSTTPFKLFIPAKALEHPANEEKYTLIDKLKAAAYRHDYSGTFETPAYIPDSLSRIFIKDFKFNPPKMGYDTEIEIRG